ncbi:methyltransferase family protein [Mycolicibacterium arseniciresistens]|uniref:Isoprenylcysteine carboxylmethyltransferase family protein n=1 Tax=Mycolicibacterium arseniciresistens TaxID=3062257 RepID=A0ABT8UJJ8_9MYCO|nr:isoprenylcysteine carboxylmethyltransferase family protein [Mycolicibacterium arseniciresistens]MDO3637972.1 isoprenylcysteine carboxylmethyltransferase family protein [Mycolicibacterium arseniciresistens]
MSVAALVLFALFVLLVVARALLQRHRTGDTGGRQSSIPFGSTQWWWHWVFQLGLLLTGVAAPIADLVGLAPLGVLNHPFPRWLGVVMATLGALAAFAGELAMGASWRIAVDESERTGLVTGGPFRLVRNPIYSAMLGAFVGLMLMVPNVIALGGLVIAVVGIEATVRLVEEPYLRRMHGPAYDDYASRVGRFLPGIGRVRSNRPAAAPHPDNRGAQ